MNQARRPPRPAKFPEPRRRAVRQDTVAGLVNAVVSVPDGLASATLAGVNPVYGLYASIAAPIAGSALVSAQLMQISTTSASALAAGQVIAGHPVGERDSVLFLLVLLIGLWLAVFGLLRAGRLVRFVSHAVMTGFLGGVAALLILDQSAPFVGVNAEGSNEVAQFFDLLTRTGDRVRDRQRHCLGPTGRCRGHARRRAAGERRRQRYHLPRHAQWFSLTRPPKREPLACRARELVIFAASARARCRRPR